jgi:hypothetical protein
MRVREKYLIGLPSGARPTSAASRVTQVPRIE